MLQANCNIQPALSIPLHSNIRWGMANGMLSWAYQLCQPISLFLSSADELYGPITTIRQNGRVAKHILVTQSETLLKDDVQYTYVRVQVRRCWGIDFSGKHANIGTLFWATVCINWPLAIAIHFEFMRSCNVFSISSDRWSDSIYLMSDIVQTIVVWVLSHLVIDIQQTGKYCSLNLHGARQDVIMYACIGL